MEKALAHTSASAQQTRPLRGYLLALLAGVTWAGSGLISEWIGADPMVLTGARTLASALLIGLGLLLFNRRGFKAERTARSWGFLLLYGLIAMAANQYLYFASIHANGAGLGTLLKYSSPVFLLAIGALFLHRRITLLMVAGAAVALIGLALAVGAFSGHRLTLTSAGLAWGLSSGLFFSLHTLFGEVGNRRFEAFTLLFYGMLIAALFWLAALGPARVIAPFLHVKPFLQLMLLASVSTVLPFGAYLVALKYIDSVHASIAAMVEAVAAGVGGALFFGEPLTVSLIFGGIISLGAIVVMRLSDVHEARST